MTGFKDIHLPEGVVGYPTSSAPRFSTSIVSVSSGAEQRNQNWSRPLHRFNLAEAVRDQATYAALAAHWLNMRGPAFGFPFRDPLDFASVAQPAANVAPPISRTDVVLGAGDGLTRHFQLVKRYALTDPVTGETDEFVRPITLPIVSTLLVGVDGEDPEGFSVPLEWTVSRPGGVIEFSTAPEEGAEITAGFLFEVPVRFEADDSFEGIVRNYRVSGFADLTLIELRPC
jgi:uncharacterized protein (TIGR02217 family)